MEAPLHFGRIQPGQVVLTTDGAQVGVVKEVDDYFILVDRVLQRDIYIPVDDVTFLLQSDGEDDPQVILDLTEDQMSVMDWDHPPIIGS